MSMPRSSKAAVQVEPGEQQSVRDADRTTTRARPFGWKRMPGHVASDEHLEGAGDGFIPCEFCKEPIKCGLLGKRQRSASLSGIDSSNMDVHHAICPKTLAQCPFRDLGCFEPFSRDAMAEHLCECAAEHARLIAASLTELRHSLAQCHEVVVRVRTQQQ